MAESNISRTTCNPSVAVTANASSWFICTQIHGQTKSKKGRLIGTPTYTHTYTHYQVLTACGIFFWLV